MTHSRPGSIREAHTRRAGVSVALAAALVLVGTAALAGTTIPIDRENVAKRLARELAGAVAEVRYQTQAAEQIPGPSGLTFWASGGNAFFRHHVAQKLSSTTLPL